MSQKSVEAIIGKILLDSCFRDVLLADPDQTLACYELTEIELAWIKRLDSETMDFLGNTVAERIRRINQTSPGNPIEFPSGKEREL